MRAGHARWNWQHEFDHAERLHFVGLGGQAIELRAGEQLVIAGSTAPSFADVNPLSGIACRELKEFSLATGDRAFICQFSLASALENLSALKQLARSSQSRDRDIHAKILKNAAILHMVTARKGPYKTWRRLELPARAI